MKMACIFRYQNGLTFLGFLKCHVDLANHLYFQARERELDFMNVIWYMYSVPAEALF